MIIYFGENLKSLRKARGITQESFANYLGVSFQAVSKWERNDSYPDIELLPEIADFFGVTVDELLGINRAENEQKVNEYLSIYDNMQFNKIPELIEIFKNAIEEFPNNFHILVRYMELLTLEKDVPFIVDTEKQLSKLSLKNTNNPYKLGFKNNLDYDKNSQEILNLYEKIQKHCTNDDIRIWSKHIVINHLMNKYECSYDEKTEKWKCDHEALKKAENILKTLPSLYDSRECVELRLNQDSREINKICRNNIEELSYLLQNSIISYCYYPYDNNFSAEYKINVIKHINGIFEMIDNDDYISKNRIHLMYNYGHLGWLYNQLGDDKKAVKYLKISAEYARKLDFNFEETKRIACFYELQPELKEMNMCQRMAFLITKSYPLSDNFKSTKEFKEILNILE